MTRAGIIGWGLAVLMALPALADAPKTSLRPVARPGSSAVAVNAVAVNAAVASALATGGAAEPVAVKPKPKPRGLFGFLRPNKRPKSVEKQARQTKAQLAKGMVCKDPALQGTKVGYVEGRLSACGIEDAVRLRSVSGVALSQEALMDCTTAKALKTWVDKGMKPAIGKRGGGVAQIKVAAHYACRTRNNQRGAKVSEHGKGRAIDISAFRLNDGSEITVLNDWGRGKNGAALKAMRRRACGPFGTVLGPGSDRFHADHFHFDTARYRSGSYCR